MERSEKDKWIDEVMGSLKGMQRVPAPAGMYEGVMARLKAGERSKVRVLLPRVAAVAAMLLLAVNIASVYHVTHRTKAAAVQQGIYNMVDQQISDLETGF